MTTDDAAIERFPFPKGGNLAIYGPDEDREDVYTYTIAGDLRQAFNPDHNFDADTYGFEVDGNYGAEKEVREAVVERGVKGVTFDSEQSCFFAYALDEDTARTVASVVMWLVEVKNGLADSSDEDPWPDVDELRLFALEAARRFFAAVEANSGREALDAAADLARAFVDMDSAIIDGVGVPSAWPVRLSSE